MKSTKYLEVPLEIVKTLKENKLMKSIDMKVVLMLLKIQKDSGISFNDHFYFLYSDIADGTRFKPDQAKHCLIYLEKLGLLECEHSRNLKRARFLIQDEEEMIQIEESLIEEGFLNLVNNSTIILYLLLSHMLGEETKLLKKGDISKYTGFAGPTVKEGLEQCVDWLLIKMVKQRPFGYYFSIWREE